VSKIRGTSTDKVEKVSPVIDHDVEQEEDRIQGASSKGEESQVSDRSSEKTIEKEEEARDAPAEESQPEEPEEKEIEDEFNQIVDPEVEERVLVLTESVDDLRAEFHEFKRSSTIERERLELEVRQAKEELQRAKLVPPVCDDNSIVEAKESSALIKIASMFSEQFDDDGYMRCMLSN